MKHIRDEGAGWLLDDYFKYIESKKPFMPPALYEFASDRCRYELSGQKTLHDAWLEELQILEMATGERKENRPVEIACRFLGAYHDVEICLQYKGVLVLQMEGVSLKNGYGDLLMHEICVTDEDLMSHELIFSTGSKIIVVFADFNISTIFL